MHELRHGLASHPAVSALVRSAQRPLPPRDDGIEPTTLYPTNDAKDKLNQERLEQLDRATERTYLAKDWIEPDHETSPPPTPNPNISPHEQRAFGEKVAAVEKLQLRLGAQVMLIKNEIVQLDPEHDTPQVSSP